MPAIMQLPQIPHAYSHTHSQLSYLLPCGFSFCLFFFILLYLGSSPVIFSSSICVPFYFIAFLLPPILFLLCINAMGFSPTFFPSKSPFLSFYYIFLYLLSSFPSHPPTYFLCLLYSQHLPLASFHLTSPSVVEVLKGVGPMLKFS